MQLTTATYYQSPRVSSSPTLPTLPPISSLSYNNNLLPPITGNGSHNYKGPSNAERNEQQYHRYPSPSSLSMNTPQTTPTTPYSASSTSSFSSYLTSSPLPQQPPPTQPPTPLPQSQPSYYQRSPPSTSYYSQPTYSSYSPYPQSHSPVQHTSRRPPQQLQQHYPSQQQYSLQSPQITSHHPHSQSTTQQTPTPIRPYQRNHNSQNVISEPFVTVTPELNNRPPRRRRRPPFSYSSLIAQAILDSPDRRLTLREVYQWIMERYPQLYKADDTGWQNTIRHNLSLNKCFKKVPRSDTELGHSTSSSTASKGKGGYWTIDPEYMSSYHDGVFARGGVQKRRPGEVGLHPMGGPGLDDDSGGSDTPSDSMAGRLVDVVDDDGESGYNHHHNHHINQQHHYHHMHHNHNGVVGNTGERMPLTLTVPPVSISPSTSLMTPPLTSNLLNNKSKKFYATKRHSSEPSFENLASPSSPPYASSVNTNGSSSGRYAVFHVADLNDKSNTDLDGMGIASELYQEKMQTLTADRQFRVINHPSSNRDISPYSVGSRSSGPDSEWSMSDLHIKREIDQRDGPRNSSYYLGSHSMIPVSRGVTDLQQVVGDIDSSHSSISSMVGSSSMKIRDLLN